MSDGLPGCRTVVYTYGVSGRVCELQHPHLFSSHVPEIVELLLGEVENSTHMPFRNDEDVTWC